MVFKIHQQPDFKKFKTDTSYFFCDIFWINDLNDITDTSKIYIYSHPVIYHFYVFLDEDTLFIKNKVYKQSFQRFRKFYKEFEVKAKISADKEKPFMWKSLTTNIFQDSNVMLWNYQSTDSIGYYLFHVNFLAALLEYNYVYDYDSVVHRSFSLLPVSKAYEFRTIEQHEMEEAGFVKSEWLPEGMFK
jgi:hypothetical protein